MSGSIAFLARFNPLMEVKVTVFLTSDEADFVPTSCVGIQRDGTRSPDWTKVIEALMEGVSQTIEGAPLTNLRPMTISESRLGGSRKNERFGQ